MRNGLRHIEQLLIPKMVDPYNGGLAWEPTILGIGTAFCLDKFQILGSPLGSENENAETSPKTRGKYYTLGGVCLSEPSNIP